MMREWLFLGIPLLPLAAFFVIAFGGSRMNEQAHRVGIPCLTLAFVGSLWAVLSVARHGPLALSGYQFIDVGDLQITLGIYGDQLTVLLLVLVTGVSSLVHVYSSRYMQGDPRYQRFFAVIALFTFSMIMLVMSANLLMLFIFWEVMGMCSYLLISHYSERPSACRAATKAFLVNAVAGVGLGFGVILTFSTFGTLDIQTVVQQASSMRGHTVNLLGWLGLEWPVQTMTVIALFLFLGAIGKSSQVPLHVWLPFAMEAPTPVSALIHAATMVNAGVFLVARLSPLFLESGVAMTVIAVIGGLTALFGACLALVQSDIKKILAYSTMSQIGYMIFACGIGAFMIAIFHLLAHGALKAFLFLSTGNALRHLTPEPQREHARARQPIRHLGTMPIGALLFAAVPPLVIFSGPYAQLWTAGSFLPAHVAFWGLGLATVWLTAWYVFRGMTALVPQPPVRYGHPMMGLSVEPGRWSALSLVGFVGIVGAVTLAVLFMSWNWTVEFLSPVFVSADQPDSGGTLRNLWSIWVLLPLLVAVGGWGLAYGYSRSSATRSQGVSRLKHTLYVFFLNRGYIDDLYEVYIVAPTLAFARWLWQRVDMGGIDRAVKGLGVGSLNAARWLWQVVDIGGIDRMIKGLARFSILLARWLWRVVDLRGFDRAISRVGVQSQGLGAWLWRRVEIHGVDRGMTQVGQGAEEAGETLQDLEPRMLQHHLLVLIFWLVLVMAFVFWLIF